MDCDTRPGRPDLCPTDKFPQKNTRYQVARENQQHRDIHKDTGSQMESSHPKTKTEMQCSKFGPLNGGRRFTMPGADPIS